MSSFETEVMDDFSYNKSGGAANGFNKFGEYDALEEYLFEDGFDEMFGNVTDGWDELETDYGIIGTDGRVRVSPLPRNPSTRLFPFNTICYIQVRNPGGFSAWGSGNLVTPRVLLTAGHVLRGAGNRQLRITPGAAFDSPQPALRSTGSPSSQIVNRSHFRMRPDFVGCTATDYGLVILPRAFNRPTRFMPLQARAASRSAIRTTIAGFPGDKQRIQNGTMWRHSDGIETVATTDGLLRHRIDTMPGSSGSPIWLLGAGDTRIQIGVHIGGTGCDSVRTRNIAVRITDSVLAQIANWCRTARVRPPTLWRSRN
jgi:glutamyl endopeptidase